MVFACSTLCGFSACAPMRPPSQPPSAIQPPAAWSQAPSLAQRPADDLARWWQRLGDADLSALIDAALRHNTSVDAARAALQQSRALREVSAAALMPTLSGSGSAQRSRSNSATSNSWRTGLDASWEPDLFGGDHAALEARDADAAAANARLGDAQVSVAAEVALDYLQLRSSQARIAIAQANLANQQDIQQIAQWRAQAGLASALDVEQARAATAQTQAQLPALDASITKAGHALAVLTGEAPGTLNASLQAARPLPLPAQDLALSLPADTLRQRPDVRAAEAAVVAAAARVTQADAARYPSLHLGGSIGLNALTLGSLTSGGSLAASLLANVSMPLFDGGATQATVRAQQAAMAQAQANHRGAVLAALKDVEDALVALRADRERATALAVAAQSAADAALLARQRYQSGLIDFQTVLDTQRTQLSAQDAMAGVQADIAADHVRLYKALGGGWTPDANTPVADAQIRPPQKP